MNIAVVAGRVSRHPWSTGAAVLHIATALARRGHHLTLIADAIDDPDAFAAIAAVITREGFRTGASDFPLLFPRWALRRLRRTPHDAAISLTWRIAAPVWMPIDPSPSARLRSVRDTRSFIGAAGSFARHWGALIEAPLRALAPLPPGPSPRRVLTIGAPAAEAARTFSRGLLDTRILAAPLTSTLPLADPSRAAEARSRLRVALAIDPTAFLVAVSVPDSAGPFLNGFLEALARISRSAATPPIVALILTREPFRTHTAARRTGALDNTRILGLTHAIAPLLDACDAVATVIPTPLDPFRAGNTSRFAADALRRARPVLALAGSPGIAALRLALPDGAIPGLVVPSPSSDDWLGALAHAADPAWLIPATTAAARLASLLDSDRLIDALESALPA